jgi:hypothetical protein
MPLWFCFNYTTFKPPRPQRVALFQALRSIADHEVSKMDDDNCKACGRRSLLNFKRKMHMQESSSFKRREGQRGGRREGCDPSRRCGCTGREMHVRRHERDVAAAAATVTVFNNS